MSEADMHESIARAGNRRCPLLFVKEYFGLDLAGDGAVRRDYEFWMRQRNTPEPFEGDTVDRWSLELFLQSRKLVPLKWAALRLGMTYDSLARLRRRMDETGPLLAYHPSPELVGKAFEEDLLAQLPRYRFRTFADHNAFCRQLHDWIKEEFKVEPEPEFCATSLRVDRGHPNYAKYLDILTLEPVGPRYQVWLDFGKWLTLPPDRCSVLTFAAHRETLAPFLAGREPLAVPPEVEAHLAGAPR